MNFWGLPAGKLPSLWLDGAQFFTDIRPRQVMRRGHVTLQAPDARSNVWLVGSAFIAAMVLCSVSSGQSAATPPSDRTAVSEYVGSRACGECHKEIYASYSHTAMGRSMSTITPDWLNSNRTSGSVEDKNTSLNFEVYARDGKLYQSEYQTDSDGHGLFRDVRQMQWIIGAGENGLGALLKDGDFIFQAPLSFYSKAQRWELSPGYELGNAGFNRPVLPGCISCHSGRPNALPEGNGHFGNPAFAELAVGCENCHGPGLTHVTSAQMHTENYEGHDHTIVNPASLSPVLADNVCISCHQTGDVRVLKLGKQMSDFRPGTALDDTLTILMVPPRREDPPHQDLLEHYYSMTLSKCYRAGGNRLRCISCHDPHVEPTRERAPAYFKEKCLACHSEKSCSLPFEIRQHRLPADDCAGCHMQKREVTEISHSSITNHRILAKPDEPFPDVAFQQTTSALPDLIHLNPAPGKEHTTPPPIVLLEAYGELMESHPEFASRYFAVLNELERSDPANAVVQGAAGNRDLHQGKYQEAADQLRHAIQGGLTKTILYTDLAEALIKLNQRREAVQVLHDATAVDPYNAELRKRLIVELIQVKDYGTAKAEMEDYVHRFPADGFMRAMLTRVQSMERSR